MSDRHDPTAAPTACPPAPDHALSLAYMRAHPAQAARVLEALPAEQATALLATTPARVAAPVLGAMLPPWAARCLGALDDSRTLDLLAAMGTQPAVAVMRHLAATRRRVLAASLPTAVGLASSVLLGYAADSAGAWLDPDIVMLPAGTRIADALAHVRSATTPHARVYVAGPDRRLLGQVDIVDLLKAPPVASLSSLMQPPPPSLAAHAPLATAAAHPGWQQASTLPVLAADGQLLGVMSHDALLRTLRQRSPASDDSGAVELTRTLARGYWQALSGLIGLALNLLPPVPPLQPPAPAQEQLREPR